MGVDAMRRVSVIMALGVLLGISGGVVTAAPAVAGGRGGGWQVETFQPGTLISSEKPPGSRLLVL